MNSDIYNELTDSLKLILTPVEIECNEIISFFITTLFLRYANIYTGGM